MTDAIVYVSELLRSYATPSNTECRYCKRPMSARRIVGATLPQAVNRFYACASPDEQCKAEQREQFAAFNAMDANCNTCNQLIREPHPKCLGGLLYGRCAQGTPADHPYASRQVEGVFPFPPEDHMGMKCWQPRA